MQQENETVEPINTVVVRLLSGLLRGCEFTLPLGKTLFLVNDEDTIKQQHQGTVLADNTIFIPARDNGCNFELLVSDDDAQPVILREIQEVDDLDQEESIPEKAIPANEIITVGEQKLAWRNSNDVFSDEILGELGDKDIPPTDTQNDEELNPPVKHSWWKWLVIFIILGCFLFASYIYLTETQRQISSVSDFLDGGVGHYNIVSGKDKKIYIIASNNKSAEWATQSMVRVPQPYHTQVLASGTEALRIGKWIESNWPYVILQRIILDNPKQPVLELSSERTKLNELDRKNLIASVTSIIPYADNVVIKKVSDKRIKMLARDGLEKMALSFTEIKNSNSVTFVIRGAIEDGELERIKSFITEYHKVWGMKYVQFALELKNDWLKGKSYKYGEQGYVKLAPGHWYFPRDLKKEL